MFSRNKTVGLIEQALVLLALTGLCGSSLRADTFGGFTYTTNSTSATITAYTGPSDLIIPETLGGKPVKTISAKMFYGLTSAFIPASVTSIAPLLFSFCYNLTSIVVDSSNPTFSSEEGVLFNKNKTTLVQYPGALTGSYTVPSSVTELGSSAFLGCSLTSVILPANLSVMNPQSSLGKSSLESISIHADNPNYSSDGGVLFNKTKTKVVRFPAGRIDAYQIPLTVTNIGTSAFYDCRMLPSVTIPSSVKTIETYAFGWCKVLDDITLPSDLAHIEDRVFFGCENLSEINIPPSATSIGVYSFFGCKSLTSITFASNVTSVGENAFNGCTNLVRADFLGNAPSLGSSVFTNCAAGFKVYYLDGKSGFTSPTWNGYPSAVLGGATILPTGIPTGTEYETWVLTNAAAWNAVNFTAIPAADFEKAYLLHTIPETNMASKTVFQVDQITVGSNQIQVKLGLDIRTHPKADKVNGWLAFEGRESMTNAWQVIAGQSASQNKLSFTNGHATVLFDKPADMRFFRPRLQKDVPNSGTILPLNQTN